MRFPKFNHPWLCQNLLYSPAYLWFLTLLAPGILESRGIPVSGEVFLILFMPSSIFALWYLFHYFPLLLISDAVFSEIHTWQRDRLEYSSRINGFKRETALRRICRRCALWGRRWKEGSDEQFTVYCKHAYSWTVFYSMIEKRIVLCQTERLDPEQYRLLLGQARNRLCKAPEGTPRFHSKQERKAPRAYVSMIVILADHVDEAVKSKARELPINKDECCILPCVVECPTGHYYMNGGKNNYMTGMMGRPVQNFARGMARRLVFGVGLPKKNPDKRPPFNPEILDKTLWEYIREFKRGMKEERSAEDKERAKMIRRLKNEEIRRGKYAIYCKLQNRVAAWAYLPDEEDETLLSLLPGNSWYYQRRSDFIFRNEFNCRKMKPVQIEEVDQRIRAWLTANGYRVEADED